MTFKSPIALAIAAALFALPSPGFALMGSAQSSQSTQGAAPTSRAKREAAKMVSAEAVFTSNVDARKMSPGSQLQVKLVRKVQLDNGPELPAGTLLEGRIVADNTQSSGTARLAMRFTQAKLKDGQTLPVKATIVDVYNAANYLDPTQFYTAAGPIPWNRQTTAVDQIGAVSGVNLRSNIASPNSGVFVSTKKDDIKLSKSVGVELAIAPRTAAGQPSMGGA